MLKKESFVHYQTPKGRSLGFSAILVPMSDKPTSKLHYNKEGDMVVKFGLTFCNPKDKHFCKRIAREQLRTNKAREIVRVRDIPELLSKAANKSMGFIYHRRDDFDFLLKTFV